MFEFLNTVGTQVAQYSSVFGQIWYLLVFGFRLIIVTSLGGDVYGDEKGDFKCSTIDGGCTGLCYDKYAKISHMRLWCFQIIAVVTPTILFHFYVSYVNQQVKKIDDVEELRKNDNLIPESASTHKTLKRHDKRVKKVGKYERKQTITVIGSSTEIVKTVKIMAVLLVTLLLRFAAEVGFMFVGYNITLVENTSSKGSGSNFLWLEVPKMYECRISIEDDAMVRGCGSHLKNHVSCFISRPTEKTIFLRYMNIVTFLCLIMTFVEIFVLTTRLFRSATRTRKSKHDSFNNQLTMSSQRPESGAPPVYQTTTLQDILDEHKSQVGSIRKSGEKPRTYSTRSLLSHGENERGYTLPNPAEAIVY